VNGDIFEDGDPFDDPSWQPAGKSKLRTKRFIGCPIPWLAWVAPLLKSKEQLIVMLYLYRRCCICRSNTVAVPTEELEELGIGRWGKYRLLRLLEQAGVLRVEETSRQETLKVRLLHWPAPPS
jgi:hypothetical protein